MRRTFTVLGTEITINTINQENYISLSDIAKRSSTNKPAVTIQSWLKNQSTLTFLKTWELVHNEHFKVSQMANFRELATDNRSSITVKKFVEQTNAIGITAKPGRNGGTYAHEEIALNFCYWLNPEFQVYFFKEFIKLKQEQFLALHQAQQSQSFKWHISKITDNIDEARNLLDTIPGQLEQHKRIDTNLLEE